MQDVDPLLFAVLYVACCYGDVQLLLLKYTSRDSSLKERGTLTETLNDKEFHQFHSYVSRDVWRRVLEISDRLGDSRILFLLVRKPKYSSVLSIIKKITISYFFISDGCWH